MRHFGKHSLRCGFCYKCSTLNLVKVDRSVNLETMIIILLNDNIATPNSMVLFLKRLKAHLLIDMQQWQRGGALLRDSSDYEASYKYYVTLHYIFYISSGSASRIILAQWGVGRCVAGGARAPLP